MASAYKVLGQSNPPPVTLSSLYQVPVGAQAVVSTLAVCNTGASWDRYRVAVRVGGAGATTASWLVYDAGLNANDTITLTLGVTLAAGDVLSVYTPSSGFAFQAFGSEIT